MHAFLSKLEEQLGWCSLKCFKIMFRIQIRIPLLLKDQEEKKKKVFINQFWPELEDLNNFIIGTLLTLIPDLRRRVTCSSERFFIHATKHVKTLSQVHLEIRVTT